jgi:hypothetical protein
MILRSTIIVSILTLIFHTELNGQAIDSSFILSAIVYDGSYRPVPATHVINMNTHQGDVTDSLGIFQLVVNMTDTLLVRNIAFYDTLVPVYLVNDLKFIVLSSKRYMLQEARIFEWGSTYSDFKKAIIEMPNQQTLGESMGLPQQDPDYVPLEMDEKAIKSVGFLLASPISYFYLNFNKEAKSARKVYWLKKNQAKQEHFDELISGERLTEITSLTGDDLQEFQAFLFQRMVCTSKCTDIQIFEEVFALWKVYQELKEKGII